jgi:hypothetical protein
MKSSEKVGLFNAAISISFLDVFRSFWDPIRIVGMYDICECVCVYICMYVCMYVYAVSIHGIHTYIHTCRLRVKGSSARSIHTYIHRYAYTYIHVNCG